MHIYALSTTLFISIQGNIFNNLLCSQYIHKTFNVRLKSIQLYSNLNTLLIILYVYHNMAFVNASSCSYNLVFFVIFTTAFNNTLLFQVKVIML